MPVKKKFDFWRHFRAKFRNNKTFKSWQRQNNSKCRASCSPCIGNICEMRLNSKKCTVFLQNFHPVSN